MRERKLFAGTVASGIAVLAFHIGYPAACISAGAAIEKRPVQVPLEAGQEDTLMLVRGGAEPVATSSTSLEAARALVQEPWELIGRGTVLEVRSIAPNGSRFTTHGALAAVDPARRSLRVDIGSGKVAIVPIDEITQVTVLGESPQGYVGTGALIGGLGLGTLAALAGGEAGGRSFGAFCAAGFGVSGGLVGAGTGALVGWAAEPDRARTEHQIGDSDWRIDVRGSAPPPGSTPKR